MRTTYVGLPVYVGLGGFTVGLLNFYGRHRYFGAGRSGVSSELRSTSLQSPRETGTVPGKPPSWWKPGDAVPVAARDPTGPSLEVGGAACRAGLGDGIVGVTTTSCNAIEAISIFGFSGAGIVDITPANEGAGCRA